MTEHWDPYRKLEKPTTTRSDIWLPSLVPALAMDVTEKPPQLLPAIPMRRSAFESWKARERAGIDRAMMYLTVWMLALTYTAVGIFIGMVISYIYSIAIIILQDAMVGG